MVDLMGWKIQDIEKNIFLKKKSNIILRFT